MKSRIIFLCLCLTLLCGCASAPAPSAAPVLSPSAAETPVPSPEANSNEAARAYAQNVGEVLNILDTLEREYTGEVYKNYYENCFSGALSDLDNDGSPELIMAYCAEDSKLSLFTYCYRIYTCKDGSSVLIDEGELFVDAGAPRGGLSVVNYGGENLVCIWNSNSRAGDHTTVSYFCELFAAAQSKLVPRCKMSFTYALDKGEPTALEQSLLVDGKPISFDEFLEIKSALDSPVKELCTVGKGFTNYRLRLLYEDLNAK